MLRCFRLPAFCVLSLLPFGAAATEASDLARLSKDEFMEKFEQLLPEMMAAQQELFVRFDPELAQGAIDTGPITAEERAAASCMWDKMEAQGLLEGWAKQILLGEAMMQMMRDQPDLDIVDFFMNEDVMDQHSADVPDEVIPAMQACGSITASTHRATFSPEVWAAMGAAAEARGYTN